LICGIRKMIMATCESGVRHAELPGFAAAWNVRPPAYGGVPWG
jgi:hypothetical protein